MKWAALIVWIITALGGFGLLAIWLQRGGINQGDQPGRRIRPPLIFSHLGLAATGLVLWIVYVASDSKAIAWIAFVLLLIVASLGFGMFALWLQRRQATAAGGSPSSALTDGSQPAEQHFPVPVVALHGVVAATTLVLVLLTAAGVGS
jgi:flagellar basal body-associated protein FliL